MKVRAFILLFVLVSTAVAETNEQLVQRLTGKPPIEKPRKPSPLLREGLLIESWEPNGSGWAGVTITNTTDSPLTFDYHQLEAIDYDLRSPAEAAEVRFSITQIASYSLDAHESRMFRLRFVGGHALAAVRWKGGTRWLGFDGGRYADISKACDAYRDILIDLRKKARREVLLFPQKP